VSLQNLGTPSQWVAGGIGALVGFWLGDIVGKYLPGHGIWPKVAEFSGAAVGIGVAIAVSPATPAPTATPTAQPDPLWIRSVLPKGTVT
jgi:hypothetical protein